MFLFRTNYTYNKNVYAKRTSLKFMKMYCFIVQELNFTCDQVQNLGRFEYYFYVVKKFKFKLDSFYFSLLASLIFI